MSSRFFVLFHSSATIGVEEFVARPAEELLEFDKLKEIVAGRAHHVRAGATADRSAFAAERCASAAGGIRADSRGHGIFARRLGAGIRSLARADPEGWLPRLTVPAAVLASSDLLEASTLMDAATAVRQTFKELGEKHPRLAERAAALADLRHLDRDSPRGAAERRNQRRRFAATAAHSGGHGRGAATNSAFTRKYFARARRTRGRGLRDAAERPLRDPGARSRPARGARSGARPSATGQTVFVEPLESIDLNNRLVQLREDEAVEVARILAELTDRLRADRGPAIRKNAEEAT